MIDLTPVMESYIEDFESQLKTALPATVVSFDSDKQTIVAQVAIQEAYRNGEILSYPEISNIPVIFPSAGGGSLTFPIKKGDEVLLVFSSRSFDIWWDTSISPSLSTSQRYHDISDAIAIVGITSKNNSVKASTEDVELKFNDNKYVLKENGDLELVSKSKVSISNQQEELVNLLSETLAEIANITVPTIYGVSPINNKAAIEALKVRLDTFKI